MSLGEKARLTISPDYGYGDRGYPPVYPFNVYIISLNSLLVWHSERGFSSSE